MNRNACFELRRLAAALIVSVCLFHTGVMRNLSAAALDQNPTSPRPNDRKPVPLEPGKPIQRDFQGGEKHNYQIRAEAGQFVHAVVEQFGLDVALTIYAPDRTRIASMDSPNGAFGLEQISTIADPTGPYTLEVAADDKNTPAGRYSVKVERLRPPGGQDRGRITAERTLVGAVRLGEDPNPESLRGVITKYVSILPMWYVAGDGYEEAMTGRAIGDAYFALGARLKITDFS